MPLISRLRPVSPFALQRRLRRPLAAVSIAVTCAALSACGADAPEAPAARKVPVHTVSAVQAPIFLDLNARVVPYKTAEIRARATGIVIARHFSEGSWVAAGDTLFSIDPAPLTAALAQAQAEHDLAAAELTKFVQLYDRHARLLHQRAISQQDYDTAKADKLAAAHRLAVATAQRDAARIRLSHTAITAPISGHIGLAQVTEGALVSEAEATLLAKIHQLDPIHIDATQSTYQAARYAQDIATGALTAVGPTDHPAFLTLAGQDYPHHGAAHAFDSTVDPHTDRFIVRATFPNPDRKLLPGMFVTLRVPQGIARQVLTVPQTAVIKGLDGKPAVMRVAPDHRVTLTPVQLGDMRGTEWQIRDGVAAGDHIVARGADALRSGQTIDPDMPRAAIHAIQKSGA